MSGYSNARAVKKSSSFVPYSNSRFSKKTYKKVAKSPLLILFVVALLLGAVCGYFLSDKICCFKMKDFSVAGTCATEKDYVVVDISALKEQQSSANSAELLANLTLVDEGVDCKFFGQDLSGIVSVSYLYREDISKDTVEVDGINATVPGVYYVKYQCSHFAFKNITLIRTVVVMEVEA